jgi:ADP-ribose pyrophosphatase YjhB (NUDIX family)
MNNYCINCGKSGHNSKICNNPITSCGIICFKIDNLPISKIEKFLFNKYINIEDYNYNHIDYYNKTNFHRKDIKFLLIQRKHSLSYIEFLRGKYDENNIDKVTNMFELMAEKEVENIKNNDFDYLWNNLWKETAKFKSFLKEMVLSKNKFIHLKNNNIINKLKSKYFEPEWGFPKGRRTKYENNYECAHRELVEETNLLNYMQFDRIGTIEETFNGTDNNLYKHIYYIAGSDEDELTTNFDNYEVDNIGWFTIDQVLNLLRPYNKSKIDLINQLYFFLTIVTDKINDKTNNNRICYL